jgi:CO/xanthine dehydrogenase FAD-binding subunit
LICIISSIAGGNPRSRNLNLLAAAGKLDQLLHPPPGAQALSGSGLCLDMVFGGWIRLEMFIRPRSLEEAVTALAEHGGTPISGGTDLYPAWVDRPQAARLVDLKGVAELRGISVDQNAIRIGGATTWTDIIRAGLPSSFDALKAAAREVGSVQIQNSATIAGNLCNASPAADGAPPLLALDAEVELSSVAGARTLPLSQFILGNRRTARRPDEILSAVIVPRRHEEARSAFLKLGARRYLVISIVMVAASLMRDGSGRITHAAIAVGAASEVARRVKALEARLLGAPPGMPAAALVEAGDLDLAPIDDVRATAAYRRDAAFALVRRALAAVDGGGDA